MSHPLDAALGRWPELLQSLAHLSADQLTDRHQPCPACGGTDRYRWDRDEAEGGWYCNQCGGKDHAGGAGSGMDLLTRITGWSFAQAAERVAQHLGTDQRRPDPLVVADAEHIWHYTETFAVSRQPGKIIRPWSWDGSRWQQKAPPAPRPLYWARRNAGAPVLVVEGEKTADAAAKLFPDHAVCCWSSGCKSYGKADWSALRGQTVTLWPDADDPGCQAMAKLAGMLLVLDCTVAIISNDPGVPSGWDLADAPWTQKQAARVMASHSRTLPPLPVKPEPATADKPPPAPPLPASNAHFTCLGYDDSGNRYYQPHSSGQVVRLPCASHSGTNLVSIAPLPYWEALFPSKMGVSWTAAASALFEQQCRVGMFDPDIIRGRGAWWEAGQPILHLGDRLLLDGESHSLQRPGSRFHYQRLTAMEGPGDALPLSDEEAAQVWHLAERFHWDVPASGQLIAGWVVLAPICGALRWRPHIWLAAAAGSGKSTLMERFVGTLLGDMCLIPMGNSSEAGIRQKLRCDALPVVMDESEANERIDQQRIQSILTLARVASSESRASTFKGSPGGVVSSFRVRSMFLLASIATGLKQGADRRRFAQLTMRNPADMPDDVRAAHWQALDRDLDATITPEFAQRLLARTLRLIPVIRESINVLTAVGARVLGSQALGDQYGTLLAGAWHLQSSEVITEQRAEELLSASDWAPYQEELEIPDERRCLNKILQHQLRLDVDRSATTRTVLELVQACHLGMDAANPTSPVPPSTAAAALARHGLKVVEGQLLVSNSAEALARILADTAWGNNWSGVLLRVPQASKQAPQWFAGIGMSRAVALPVEGL